MSAVSPMSPANASGAGVNAAKRKKHWSHSVGVYGCMVRVYERAGGLLWLERRQKGERPRAESLGHRDRAQAKDQAKDAQAEMALGLTTTRKAPTLGVTLDAFLARQRERLATDDAATGIRSDTFKQEETSAAFWKAALGADADPTAIAPDDIERVVQRRLSGALDPHGKPVPALERRRVRTRTAAADLEFLRAAFRWAVNKKRLFTANVMAGFEIAKEKNPRRPVTTSDRYEATRDKAGAVTMELRGAGKRFTVPSWLPELLDLAQFTGRRIGAICALRYDDLRLAPTPDSPHGAIVWPADTDKMAKAWEAPLHPAARSAIDRVLVDREIGLRAKWPASPWCFPSPRNAARSVSKDLASAWLEAAETAAELPKLDGSLWHAFRRGWATSRKAFPLADVARAGGWSDTTTLAKAYTQADAATTRRVVLEPSELREGRS